MKPIVGSKIQETKITELGKLANEMLPHIDVKMFKGAFRLGIASALEKSRFARWKDVAIQKPDIRRTFFQGALEDAVPYLKKIGLTIEEAERLISVLKLKNEHYLMMNTVGS